MRPNDWYFFCASIESPNGHLKNRLEQALMLRENRDFNSLDDYKSFVREIMVRYNKRVEKPFEKMLRGA
jgi:hypothetical protein